MVVMRDNGKHHTRIVGASDQFNFSRSLISAGVLLALGLNPALADPPRGAFPRPCTAVSCTGAGGPGAWLGYGNANVPYTSGNTMTIEQLSDKTVLNWENFDIGADNTVKFIQPDGSSVALNRVWDASSNPAQIFGALQANGHVYIINRNGILFGPEARVNVGSLIASSLDIDDEVFINGLTTAITGSGSSAAAFKGDGPAVLVDAENKPILFAAGANGSPGRFKVDEQGTPLLDADGNMIADPLGQLVKDPAGVPMSVISVADGAIIKSADGGRVLLLGGNVTNGGLISTPDGQTILAAGNKIYLQIDKDVRGLLVEVDVDQVNDEDLRAALAGTAGLGAGNVINNGAVQAARGNITLVGLALNQQGRLSATTAVNANGIIRLIARDKLNKNIQGATLTQDGAGVARAGAVTFAGGSRSEISLDGEKAAETAVDEQLQLPSSISVMGRKIELLNGSEIVAPAGDVTLTALASPSASRTIAELRQEDDVEVVIEEGSRIDVSGASVALAMERNIINVELRGNELADSPLQRDGILAGAKDILVDIRTLDEDGQLPIANLANAVAGIQRTVAERSTEGGSVSINSTGKVDFQEGAEIDVSGGAIEYQDGYINTTKLVADGIVYDISEADPNMRFDAILGRRSERSEKWGQERTYHVFGGDAKGRFEKGYVEGKNAGSVSFSAYDPALAGSLIGERQIGRYQRESGRMPNGGELIIGDASGGLRVEQGGNNFRTPDVLIAQQAFIDDLDELDLVPEALLTLSTGFLEQGGFTRVSIYSNGAIRLAKDADLQLAPADMLARDESGKLVNDTAEVRFNAAQIDIKSDIDVPGGSIVLETSVIHPEAQYARDEQQRLAIGDDVRLGAQGMWANDQSGAVERQGAAPDLSAPALIDGGNIKIAMSDSGELAIGDRVSMDVSAGAWLQADGKIKAGEGGSIAIGTKPGLGRDYVVGIGEDLDLRGHALEQGGTLALQLPQVVIADEAQMAPWPAGRRNDLGELSDAERMTLVEQVLKQWRAEQEGAEPSSDMVLSAVLDVAQTSLKNDGSQSQKQQQDLIGEAIDKTRLAMEIPAQLMQRGGFANYKISASGGDLIVAEGSRIAPVMENIVLGEGYRTQPSGADMAQFSRIERLPDEQRKPVGLTLTVATEASTTAPLPQLIVEQGASIESEAGAKVSLASSGRLEIDGRISAPAGQINLDIDNAGALYDSERIILLGENAELNAAGVARLQANVEGLRIGEVLDGGDVNMVARGGGIDVAEGARIDVSGSETALDFVVVNGVRHDNQRIKAENIASSAGSINLKASEAMRLDGEMIAHANRDAGAAGGELALTLDYTDVDGLRSALGFPQPQDDAGEPRDWTIRIKQQQQAHESATDTLPAAALDEAAMAGADATEMRPALEPGQVVLTAASLEQGFDALSLATPGRIEFEGDTTLQLGRSIELNTPLLVVSGTAETAPAHVVLDAPYVAVGPSRGMAFDRARVDGLTASDGDGSLQIGAANTHLIDLTGKTAVQGVSATELNSLGDIRLRSLMDEYSGDKEYLASGFHGSGELELTAAQLYPTTLSRFTLSSADVPGEDEADVTPGRIVINPNGAAPAAVLSAAGKVTLEASEIEHHGVLKAPLGEIQFGGDSAGQTQRVTLAEGSMTSTAADVPLVPFGVTVAGNIWRYDGENVSVKVYDEGVSQYPSPILATPEFDALPEQRIVMRGRDVAVEAGATVDARGGGDLVAYEFLPGPGGSQDVLSSANATAEKSYAILPWLKDGYAPHDAHAAKGWQLDPGASIEILQSGDGLSAGTYALLPARYAMLPGAYLVTLQDGFQDLVKQQKTKLVDGTDVVAARMALANTGVHDARSFGVALREGGYARLRSEYNEARLSQFLAEHSAYDEVAIPRLPQDAGALVIDAMDSIALNGKMLSAAGENGRGAQLDIVATRLEVVNETDPSSAAVQINAADLNGFGAESILLGGVRSSVEEGIFIDVGSEQVTVKSGVDLAVPELILAAGVKDETAASATDAGVFVESGARLKGTGRFSGQAADLYLGREAVTDNDGKIVTDAISGGGALVRLSSANQVEVERANSSAGTGALSIAAGATVGAGESMVLDASGASQIAGELDISGGSLNLGAEKVSLGAAPAESAGLVLDNADLGKLALRELVLTSRDSIDLYGDVEFGADAEGQTQLQSVVLNAPGLRGHGGDATLTAGNIRLTSPNAVTQEQAASGGDSGTLRLNARVNPNDAGQPGELTLGKGQFVIDGYQQVVLAAAGKIGSEEQGRLNAAADVTLETPLLTSGAGARTEVDAGAHAVTIAASSAAATAAGGLGGTLKIKGSEIVQQGTIRMPSGQVTLHASDGDVLLSPDSVIDVAGTSRQFDDVIIDTWGGNITLRSDAGNVIGATGSSLDVSGAAASEGGGADAGLLRVEAFGTDENGKVLLNGSLKGNAGGAQRQGSAVINAARLDDGSGNGFSELNQALNAGAFNERRELRLREGGIVVESGAENGVTARHVLLSADGGDIVVNGTVGMAAGKSGSVSLNASGDLVLAGGAEIKAAALADGERGGKVLLASSEGRIRMQAGSLVDTSAGADGKDGSLHLRAGRIDSDNDGNKDAVAIDSIEGTLKGAGRVLAEAVEVNAYDGDLNINAANISAWKSATQNFMTQYGGQIATQLDANGSLPLSIVPGLEVRSTGDIVLNSDWDLSSWRYHDMAGVLSLLAGGDVLLNKSISDGFRDQTSTVIINRRPVKTTVSILQSDDSWSYRIVAGADTQSANVLAVLSEERLADGAGSVSLAAKSKVRTGNGSIDIAAARDVVLKDVSAVIYSAGVVARKDGVEVPNQVVPATSKTSQKVISWAENGGDVNISAAGDLVGSASDKSPNSWLWRQGGEYGFSSNPKYTETNWAVAAGDFEQSVAAFGGGDIQLSAGADIRNFSAAIPSSGKQASPGADRSEIDSWGGGDLRVNAGGDIMGGVYLLGRGEGVIQAGGAMTTDGRKAKNNSKKTIHPLLALGEGSFRLQTGNDLTLETVTQPTTIPRVPDKSITYNNSAEFFTYDSSAKVDMISLGGDVTLQPNSGIEQLFTDTTFGGGSSANKKTLALLPPGLKMVALNGDVAIPNDVIMQPSAESDLWLMAGKDVEIKRLIMSDLDPLLMPSPNAPVDDFTDMFKALETNKHAGAPLHQNDSEPAYIVANSGDISGEYFLPKQARLVAGRDIDRIGFTGQNLNAGDVTLIQAGRDIRFTQAFQNSLEKIQLDGPGRLDIVAGRHINLGASKGISSTGNLYNSALPDEGADVTVMAGVAGGMDLAGFIDTYFVEGDAYREALTGYMRELLAQPQLSDADALQAFMQLPPLQQRPLVVKTLYAELRAAGRAAATGEGSYERGYTAIDKLFPADEGYAGDLAMYLSRIYTMDGGDINLLLPGGLVNAGLAISTADLGFTKKPSDLGIVAQRAGDVMAMTDGDFVVNQSRVFTLLGGDVLMWSSYGNIDAGRGAKSAISAPEPSYSFDNDGNVIVDYGGAIAGSGIRGIVTQAGIEPGSVDLYAPDGVIDAGDAGIDASGNLFLGAQQVLGSDNIQVGGLSVGVPVSTASNLAAGLTGVSNLATSAGSSAEESVSDGSEESSDTPLADAALSFLEVDVLGFGGTAADASAGAEEARAKEEKERDKE